MIDDNVAFLLMLRYFEGGVSSVYLWDLDDGGFAGVVVLKKGSVPLSPLDIYINHNSFFLFLKFS